MKQAEANTSRHAEHDEDAIRPSSPKAKPRRKALIPWLWGAATMIILTGGIGWLGYKASVIKSELDSAVEIAAQIKDDLVQERKAKASIGVTELRRHTVNAREAAGDPLWRVASTLPLLGDNFSAVSEITRSADDVVDLAAEPLVQTFDSLDWDSLLPGPRGPNLEPLKNSAPSIASAAYAVKASADRLDSIDTNRLVPQVAGPLIEARDQIGTLQRTLEVAANVSKLAPPMLGSGETRRYLLLIQNNAELRATGGIPGALAVLTADNGELTISEQTSAGGLGTFVPPIIVDEEQKGIYSGRIGKFVQDVNLTPDFPTTAATVKAMWEKKKGQTLDGVISIDPVALGYILDATGPVKLSDPQIKALANGLPSELNGENVVRTLLSDVYAKISQPQAQDAYFAAVAGEVFDALSSGKSEARALIEGLGRGVEERRVLVWSEHEDEQNILMEYALSGAVSGRSVAPAQFGVYFNDGTGAKMDYYVKRTAQLIQECPVDGYSRVKVRITSTNTAPADAATSLPHYVTGDGAFGIEPGSVQTNVVAYGPTQAHIEEAAQDGMRIPFNSQVHHDRPVGTVSMLLKPGESRTVEYLFDKIVQHSEPELVVTPTTDAVKNVVINTTSEACDSGK